MKKYFLKISGHFKTTHELLKIHLFYMQLEFFFFFQPKQEDSVILHSTFSLFCD